MVPRLILLVSLAFAVPAFAQQEQYQKQPTQPDSHSDSGAYEGDQQTASDRPKQHKDEKGYVGRFFRFVKDYDHSIVAIGTLALVAVTFILAIATGFLWKATRDLVKGAEATSERQLRAYLSFSKSSLENFGTAEPIKASLKVKNCGQTPAYEVRDWMQFTIQPFPYDEIDSADFIPTSSTLGPGDAGNLIARMPKPLSHMQFSGIISGDLAIYVSGEVRYRDAFGTERVSRYRGFYRGNQAILDHANVITLLHTKQGNDCT